MPNAGNLTQELQKFGLTQAQAEIYLLLAANYQLRIQEIAAQTGIPRSSVYESLKALYELGLAEEVVEHSFKHVRAYPIGAVRHKLDEELLGLQKLFSDLEGLEETIARAGQPADRPSTVLRYYRGRAGARQLYWNSLKTNDTAYVYSDWERRRYLGLKFYERFVSESQARDIKERVLMNPTDRCLESIRRYNLPELTNLARTRIKDIRYLEEASLLVKGDTFIYGNVYAQVYLNNQEINGFEIESASFTASQRAIFETLWNIAKPLASIL